MSRRTSSSRSERSSGGALCAGAAASAAPSRGLRYVSPAAARRTASTSSLSAASLRTYPAAPPCSARRANSGSSCIVSTTTLVPGETSATRGMASSEVSSPGMLRSSTSTVGLWPRTVRSAVSASPASETTRSPPAWSSSRRKPERTTAWSSARTIVISAASAMRGTIPDSASGRGAEDGPLPQPVDRRPRPHRAQAREEVLERRAPGVRQQDLAAEAWQQLGEHLDVASLVEDVRREDEVERRSPDERVRRRPAHDGGLERDAVAGRVALDQLDRRRGP